MMDWIGTLASFFMPFFNIPLIIRLIQRKRSDDISMSWALGVWACIVLMTPKALTSHDTAFRLYGYSNVAFFTVVAYLVVYYRKYPGGSAKKCP